MKKFALILLPFVLAGCDAVGDAADTVGENLPVVGERCEHWECISESGKKRSDEIKHEQAVKKAQDAAAGIEPPVYTQQKTGKKTAPNPTEP